MSVRETLLRHKLIINQLRKKPHTWSELDDFLKKESELQEYKLSISQRQFQRHIEDILSLYGIVIENNRSKKQYYIEQMDGQVDRSLEAFDVFNLLRLGNNGSKEIIFENRRPMGTEHLAGIVHAIRNELTLKFDYHKFYEPYAEERRLLPLVLKEVHNRWYIIGQDMDKNSIRVFALDRMTGLDFLKTGSFKRIDLDTEKLFKHSFGIILPQPDQVVEEVVLSYSAFQGKYVKSLPLHETQEILVDNEDELRVKLDVYVTHDLIMEIMSVGAEVKVIAPASLVNRLNDEHRKYLGI